MNDSKSSVSSLVLHIGACGNQVCQQSNDKQAQEAEIANRQCKPAWVVVRAGIKYAKFNRNPCKNNDGQDQEEEVADCTVDFNPARDGRAAEKFQLRKSKCAHQQQRNHPAEKEPTIEQAVHLQPAACGRVGLDGEACD